MTSSNDMKLSDLIMENTRIHSNDGYISQIKKQITEFPISDIVDDKGNQYVDLVMEGGGVWGIALVGFTYTLEQADIRFLNLGGTSAGAINALLLAALGNSSTEKCNRLLEIFAAMNFEEFIDGGPFAKNLVKDFQKLENNKSLKFKTEIAFKILAAAITGKIRKKINSFGLNPGDKFESWLEKTLDTLEVSSTKDLFNNLKNNNLKIRNINIRKFREFDNYRFKNKFQYNELAIVTSDTTTESKIVLPQMAPLYWENPLTTHPKEYVRASMSIPLFFEPVRLLDLPQGKETSWKELTGYKGTIPTVAYLADGGITSNFPIDIFHARDCIPLCPTVGVKLGVDREQPLPIYGIFDYISALFDTARHNADYSFLFNNEDFSKLITFIDTAEEYNPSEEAKSYPNGFFSYSSTEPESKKYGWLEFGMSKEKKAALFALGALAARDFICGNEKTRKDERKRKIEAFNWREYKDIRAGLIVSDPQAYREWKEQIRQHSLFP